MHQDYDVIVVGGGTAGVCAAIQSARAGPRTLLVEKYGILGGTITAAAVNYPALFFAWGRQIIAGIGWDLVRRTLEETGQPVPQPAESDEPHWRQHIPINRAVFAALCDDASLQAGVELLFHAMPATVQFQSGRWDVQVCTKSGLRTVHAKALVDCTGDANVVMLAGLPVDRHEPQQPGTLGMRCSGYDLAELDFVAIDAAMQQAIAAGELRLTDLAWSPGSAKWFLATGGINNNHIVTGRAETSEGKTAAEVAGRQSLLRMLRFFRRQKGLERFTIDEIGLECGIRETVVIRGQTRLTLADYMGGRQFDDAVCFCFYPIDIHLDGGRGIDLRNLPQGVVPSIPRGAMLPADSRMLIVAGRCISGDKEAHSAYRVEAPCMAMGQAAGALAALSAATGQEPADLPMPDVRALLRRNGAIVPGA